MDIVTAIILGLTQGITEWLPVSSTGHLVFMQRLLNVDASAFETVLFDLVLHLATLFSVMFFLRRELRRILSALMKKKSSLDQDGLRHRRIGVYAVAAIVPLAITGLIASKFLEQMFSPITTAVALIVTGAILWIAEMPRLRKGRSDLSLKDAMIMGCAQAVSIVPGISRSGSTISAGAYLGLDRELLATFSFLMSIPAIVAALAYGFTSLEGYDFDLASGLIGAVVAGVSGVIALRWLFNILKKFKLRAFSAYCWAIGALAIILILVYDI